MRLDEIPHVNIVSLSVGVGSSLCALVSSDGPSRFGPCPRLVCVSLISPLTGFTYRGLAPHEFTSMTGVNHRTDRTPDKPGALLEVTGGRRST